MNVSGGLVDGCARHASRRKLRHEFVSIAGDLLPLCDFACIALAGCFASSIYDYVFTPNGWQLEFWGFREPKALVLSFLALFILYDRHFSSDIGYRPVSTLVYGFSIRFVKFIGVALVIGFLTRSFDDLARILVVIWMGLGFFFALTTRILMTKLLRLLEQSGMLSESVAVVGAGPVADRLIRHLLQSRPDSIEIVGIFDDRLGADGSKIARNEKGALNPIGTVADLIELGKTRTIDWVLLTVPCTAENRLLSMVNTLKTLTVSVGLCPQNVGLKLPYQLINYVGDGLPVTMLADRPIKNWNAVIKSAEDWVLGGLIILLLLPVMAIIALAIRLETRGPVMFKQRRYAANNIEFDIYKFRTMRWSPGQDHGVLKQTARNDPRITALGRFLRRSSLDELPQLFNVLKGEMSLVGPRPHAVNMRTEERLGHEIIDTYPHRHRVKPGMTGWAQVNGARGPTDTSEQLRRRVELDIHYVENWSLILDLKILLMTFWVVISGDNAR